MAKKKQTGKPEIPRVPKPATRPLPEKPSAVSPRPRPRKKAAVAVSPVSAIDETAIIARVAPTFSPANFNIVVNQYRDGSLSGWSSTCPVKRDVLSGKLQLSGYFPVERLRELAAATAAPRRDVFQWRPLMRWRKRRNIKWRSQYQAYGTCVGQGTASATRRLQAILWEKHNLNFESQAAVAGAYTFSRVEIGGQPGYWEGSSGIWAAKGLVEKGTVLLSSLGLPEDDYTQDEQLAMKWTASREGVPAQYEQAAAQRHAKSFTIAKTIEDVALAMQHDIVVTCCSNRWSDNGARDAAGFWRGSAHRGGHCECWDGVMFNADGSVKGLHVAGSWSDDFGSGPLCPDDMLNGTGWIYPDEAAARINMGETVLISGFDGEHPIPTDFNIVT